MSTVIYSDIDAKLQVELGDLTGNIWDTATRKQKLNQAVQWFGRMWPYEQELAFTITLGMVQEQVLLALPDSLFQPPWAILGVLIAGKRVTRQPDTNDDDPNNFVSDALINTTLTWRLKWPDYIVFSAPLGTGTGLNDPSIVGANNLKVTAWFTWYDFDVAPTSLIDISFEEVLLLKAAELCQVWAAPLASRLGRDLGSAAAAAAYATRVQEIVTALHPPMASQLSSGRPLKRGS
jgi:hypothetical protein